MRKPSVRKPSVRKPSVRAKQPSLISEDQLQSTLVQACQAIRRRVFHTSDSRKQVRTKDGYGMVGDDLAAGYPDLTVAKGMSEPAFWAELKGPRGRLEEGQVDWLDDLPAHQAFVWRSQDLDEALEIIQQGHPGGICPTCWACSREEIIARVGMRGKKRPAGSTVKLMNAAGPPQGGRR